MAKATPSLPGSSRMKMAGTTGPSIKKGTASKKVTNKVMSAAKGKGMKSKKSC